MRKILFALALPLSMVLWTSSCTKPTLIGSELLDQDEADLRFTDTLSLNARTIKEDSIKTYTLDTPNPYSSFPCGYFKDPVFGTVRAEIYAQFREGSLDPPTFEMPRLDSLVLTLAYDTVNTYGNFNEIYELEVHRILEDMDNSIDYYSTRTFETSPDVLGSLDLIPAPLTEVPFITSIGGDTIMGRFLQIRLDDALGEDMLNEAWYEEGQFFEMLKGLQFKLTNNNPTDGMLNFDLNSGFSRLRLYYSNITTEPDTVNTVYDFIVSGTTTPRHVNLQHDFAGAPVEPFFDDQTLGDSLLFLQAMSGPNIEIEIPSILSLGDGNVIVNKAEIEFYVATLGEDTPGIFPPNRQLVITEDTDGDGDVLLIDDVLLNAIAFGGNLVEEEVNGVIMQKYVMNISAHLNSLFTDGATGSTSIFLRAFPKQETTRRVVLYGPNHAQYPAKLKMTYTDINN